ncbi:hypothetical protein H632_c624p1 [Helicosporidium sp. ATCC 50920]|nr:hypothetical protein H632_c624p1 [Helicosporidium sp. ATCC 50920]|eukprot:KDD75546.1 hypothetical protein H632_c624p1 [Helicosporidium sp. ATCC 50920]
MATVRVLRLRQVPIVEHLRLEEALMRATKDNWFVINDGTPDPAIVLGISGKPEELVHTEAAAAAGVPLVKRFTGGGTVLVDQDTIFTGLVMGTRSLPGVEPFPRPIMRWSEGFFAPAFASLGAFALRENDYVFGELKFGGNAQAISRDRWVHHTSFLWRFDPARMRLLKQPARAPDYRRGRAHEAFVRGLEDLGRGRAELVESVLDCARQAGFRCVEESLEGERVQQALRENKLVSTRVLTSPEVGLESALMTA